MFRAYFILIIFMMQILAVNQCCGSTETDRLLDLSRKEVKEFRNQLKTELMKAIKEGGPAYAVKICRERAPEIAKAASEKNELQIRRTSLKFRNPENAPDQWEQKALNILEGVSKKENSTKTPEYWEIVNKDKPVFRYVQGIPTAGPCLRCHGKQLDPAAEKIIEKLYPHDNAKGFKPGELRGAFSVSIPIREK